MANLAGFRIIYPFSSFIGYIDHNIIDLKRIAQKFERFLSFYKTDLMKLSHSSIRCFAFSFAVCGVKVVAGLTICIISFNDL